jgi:hypothetical protein
MAREDTQFNTGQKSKRAKGRPKGAENKATTDFKAAVNNVLNYAAPKMVGWLESVALGDIEQGVKPAPEKALDLLAKLAEFAAPKLARTEIAGDKDAPLKTIIEWQK